MALLFYQKLKKLAAEAVEGVSIGMKMTNVFIARMVFTKKLTIIDWNWLVDKRF